MDRQCSPHLVRTCLDLQICPLSVQEGRFVCNLLVLEAFEGISAFILPVLQPVVAGVLLQVLG